jgi:O-antigen ligase
LLGALQVANGPRSWPYLYDITNAGAVGVFANRNHMGTLLLVSIPFGTALMVSTRAQGSGSRQGRLALGIAGLVLVVVGIALNGSVAALALALPVLLASAALVPAAVRWRRVALPIAAVALIGGVVIVGTNPIPSVATDLGAAESVQSRGQMWSTTETAIRDTFPLGTGLGTFEQVYRQYEQPGQITRSYVNHAHNDYLELALELGAAGIVLMVLFLAWWAIAAVRVWTTPLSSAFGRAATIASAVILAHSIVDYPLRTSAIAAIFGISIALMAQRLRTEASPGAREIRPARHVKLG